MKRIPLLLCGLAAAALFFGGCATQVARSVITPSGKPETILSTNSPTTKALLIGRMIDRGYSLEKDTEYMLSFARRLQNIPLGMALSLGGNITGAWQTVDLNLVPLDGKVRVIAALGYRAEVGVGRVTNYPSENNEEFNSFQAWLESIKPAPMMETAKESP